MIVQQKNKKVQRISGKKTQNSFIIIAPSNLDCILVTIFFFFLTILCCCRYFTFMHQHFHLLKKKNNFSRKQFHFPIVSITSRHFSLEQKYFMRLCTLNDIVYDHITSFVECRMKMSR